MRLGLGSAVAKIKINPQVKVKTTQRKLAKPASSRWPEYPYRTLVPIYGSVPQQGNHSGTARARGVREMSAAAETRFAGTCFRCGGLGHWAESDNCPWLRKAATVKEHLARIDNLKARFLEWEITRYQKAEYIRHENQLWKAGKNEPR